MNEAKEKTALCTSVGADERQSVQNTISSISALDTEINHPDENSPENFEDIMRQMQRMSDPAYPLMCDKEVIEVQKILPFLSGT